MLKLLTAGNPKVMKGYGYGCFPVVLHLAPAKTSGFEVCPARTKFCTAVCLTLAGRGGVGLAPHMTAEERARVNRIQAARLRRTELFFRDRRRFADMLEHDIEWLLEFVKRKTVVGMKAGKPVFADLAPGSPRMRICVRLNGTSDIEWERVPLFGSQSVVDRYPDLQFYDYTKIPARRVPDNYHLTYSWNEQKRAAERSEDYFKLGVNTAVVFSTAKGEPLPERWRGRRVIDGDEYDMRFLDPPGVYVGLRAKGWARVPEIADGFTVWVDRENPPALELEDFDGGDVFADLDDVFGHVEWRRS